MVITNESDLVLVLRLTDKKDEAIRVNNTTGIKIRVFTTNPDYALAFGKLDIDTTGEIDKLIIPNDLLETMQSGVIQYTYQYCTINDPEYSKVKKVITDVYFANNKLVDNEHPANVVNYQTILRLREQIEKVSVECNIEIDKVKKYVEEEYTNKLWEEIKRSNDVDIEFFKLIKELQDKAETAGVDITEINNTLAELKAADTAISQRIDEAGIKIENTNLRIDNLLASQEVINKEIDFRIDGVERKLNVINDSNDNTPGSLANTLKQSQQYTDNVVKQITVDFATADELDKVESKIPNVPGNLSAFVNDCGYISNTDILGNYYTKTQVDTQHTAIENRIDDIEQYAARKDEITIIRDKAGNIVREMTIDDEPDYDALIDAKLSEFESKVDDKIDNIDLSQYYTKNEVDTKISEIDVTGQLTNYVTKDEVYNKSEIDEKIGNIAGFAKIWYGTYDEYFALGEYDEQTIYIIKD